MSGNPINRGSSRIDSIAGYALLLDFLEEDREGWLRFLETSIAKSDLASDAAFERWVASERSRDPALVSRTRRVLARFREDVLRTWKPESRPEEDNEGVAPGEFRE